MIETLAKAGARDLSAITAVSKGGHLVNISGIGQHRTTELARGSSSPDSNPFKDLGSFIEDLNQVSNYFSTKVIENKEETEVKNTTVPDPEKQSEKQVDGQPSKPEVGLSEVALSEPVTDLESDVIVLRRKVLEKTMEIENLKSELELLKKDKQKAEKRKKEAEDMFIQISEDYDQIVDLYEIIYNHFHLGDAGVNSPEGIISPLDCRQGNFPMKREKQRVPPS
jgi:hypothetical protein